MKHAKGNCSRLITLLVFALIASVAPSAFTKAYFATEPEMIERAQVIAIVNISRVERAETKSEPFAYSEIAHATVEQTLKGTLPQTVKLYGGESFVCAQVHFVAGRHVVFLVRNHDFLVGCNWHLSVRPVKNTRVEWYVPGERLKLSWQPLDTVLQRIKTLSRSP